MPLSPPAVPVFPAGYGPLPADFDTWVENSFGFQTTGVVFRAEMHTGQTVPAATQTVIQYDTILEDPYSGWNSGSFQWSVPFDGLYAVSINTCYSATANAFVAQVRQSGSANYILQENQDNLGTGEFGGASGGVTIPCNGPGSDNIQGIAFSANASALRSTVGSYSSIEIRYVSQ